MFKRISLPTAAAALTVLLALLAAHPAAAVTRSGEPEEIRLVVGKSTVINTDEKVSRVSLGSDTVVSIVILSPRQIYLTGNELAPPP